MEAIEWLRSREPGFAELTPADRTAINHFQLLWSLFECRNLDTRGNPAAIIQVARTLHDSGRLQMAPLLPALRYFQKRYVENGATNYRFDHLQLRNADHPELVRSVMLGTATSPPDIAAALLLIIYRYRNNLHHGLKWAYDIQGQRSNFRTASRVLMSVMDMFSLPQGAALAEG